MTALEKIESYARIWRHAEAQARKDGDEVLLSGAFVRASIYEHAASIIREEAGTPEGEKEAHDDN